ncbi:MAG: carboxypeptidase-like regulatory domain-containing protein [Bacteroidota bacterium]
MKGPFLASMIALCCFYSFSQKKKQTITASFVDVPLPVILDSISSTTSFYFSYNSDLLSGTDRFSIKSENQDLDDFLRQLFVGTGLTYTYYKDQIILKKNAAQFERDVDFQITGKVLDSIGIGVANVNVFLSGTSIGSKTDALGEYRLAKIPKGSYRLVFSKIGFKTAVYEINEYNGTNRIQFHELEEDIIELKPVDVITKRYEDSESVRSQYLALFSQELLGSNYKERKCSITNPEVLVFEREDDELRVSAMKPLTIVNQYLGYEVDYFLDTFEKDSNELRFRGNLRFKQITPKSKKEANRWNQRRVDSYFGSFNHFKYALLSEKVRKQGFQLYRADQLASVSFDKSARVDPATILHFKDDYYQVNFPYYLIIEYKKGEKLDLASVEDGSMGLDDPEVVNTKRLAGIKLLNDTVRLDISGQAMDQFAVGFHGYFAKERIATAVPLNYDFKKILYRKNKGIK